MNFKDPEGLTASRCLRYPYLPGCGTLEGGLTGRGGGFALSAAARESAKERSTDVPSWASQYPRGPGESCSEYAARILKEKYGENNSCALKRGPGSEYSKIKKHCERGK